jgi:hypothetical protein
LPLSLAQYRLPAASAARATGLLSIVFEPEMVTLGAMLPPFFAGNPRIEPPSRSATYIVSTGFFLPGSARSPVLCGPEVAGMPLVAASCPAEHPAKPAAKTKPKVTNQVGEIRVSPSLIYGC